MLRKLIVSIASNISFFLYCHFKSFRSWMVKQTLTAAIQSANRSLDKLDKPSPLADEISSRQLALFGYRLALEAGKIDEAGELMIEVESTVKRIFELEKLIESIPVEQL